MVVLVGLLANSFSYLAGTGVCALCKIHYVSGADMGSLFHIWGQPGCKSFSSRVLLFSKHPAPLLLMTVSRSDSLLVRHTRNLSTAAAGHAHDSSQELGASLVHSQVHLFVRAQYLTGLHPLPS